MKMNKNVNVNVNVNMNVKVNVNVNVNGNVISDETAIAHHCHRLSSLCLCTSLLSLPLCLSSPPSLVRLSVFVCFIPFRVVLSALWA